MMHEISYGEHWRRRRRRAKRAVLFLWMISALVLFVVVAFWRN